MSSTNANAMILKGAGAACLVLSAAYIVRTSFMTEQVPVCSSRYTQSLQFSLKSQTGKLMTPEELEARAGAASTGFRDNATVVAVEGGPVGAALNIRLPKGSGSVYQESVPAGGISFRWSPSALANASSACLTYHVWFPDKFDFGSSGSLPGLFGGSQYDPKAHHDGFAERVLWGADGAGEIGAEVPDPAAQREASREKGGEIDVVIPVSDNDRAVAIGRESFWMPRGRWISLEQEVVLNEPGKDNGILRLWMDGSLKIENTEMNWRNAKEIGLSGTLVDVSYGGIDSTSLAPADTSVRVGPMIVRWK